MDSVESLAYDDLVDLLMKGTSGLYIWEAAVRLLARHGYWLRDPGFLRFVELNDEHLYASIDMTEAVAALDRGELHGDEEATNILRIAASLTIFYQVSFRDVCERISMENIKHVAEAIMYADSFLGSVATPAP